ncbi:MAG: hypothetical protein WCT85_06780, partial [Parachlamydiales bacterium]
VGFNQALGSITVSGNEISLANIGTPLAVGANDAILLSASGEINFTGDTYNANAQTYDAMTSFAINMNAGSLTTFSSNGGNINFINGLGILLSTGTDLTMNSGNGNIALGDVHAAAANLRSLVLNAGGGNITVGDLGTSGNGEFSSASFNCTDLTLGHEYADSFTFNYSGTFYALGDLHSTDTALIFPNPVVLGTSNIFSTFSVIGADITFSKTIDDTTAYTDSLTLNSGGSNINFAQAIGGTRPLLNLTILSGADITFSSNATLGSLVQFSGLGTTTFNGNLTASVSGISLTGTNFDFIGNVQTSNNGSLIISNSGILNFASAATLSGAFTQSGAGSVTLSGSITAGQPILFSGATTLSGSPSLNTSAANQTITFANTVDGPGNLSLSSGANGNTTFSQNIGSITALGNINIASAHNVTTQAVTASSFIQSSGSGTTVFNGDLATSNVAGINLTGTNFTRGANWLTTGSGPIIINNTGLFRSTAPGSITLSGLFNQSGSGNVSISGSLSTNNALINFSGPVSLEGNMSLSSGSGLINFNNTIDAFISGAADLSLTTDGSGDINFHSGAGSSIRLGAVSVANAKNLTINGLRSTSFVQTTGNGTTTLNNTINTNAVGGINLTNNSFAVNSTLVTTSFGPVTITHSLSSSFIFGSNTLISSDFQELGTGNITLQGVLHAVNSNITFTNAVTLTNNTTLNSDGGNDIVFNSTVNGNHDLNLIGGLGNIFCNQIVGGTTALLSFIVSSSNDINLNGIGSIGTGVNGTLNLTASNDINMANNTYNAHTQIYSAGNKISLNTGSQTNITSYGGAISFTNGIVDLGSGNDLQLVTNNGHLSFVTIHGNSPENVIINTGTGTASLGTISGDINNLFVNGGKITFSGTIDANNISFVSLTDITNVSSPVAITSAGNAIFNGLGGYVGSLSSPILVHSSGQVFAGAGGIKPTLAVFNGSTVDNTIHEIPSNPPCRIIFNGIVIKDCNFVPPVINVFALPFAVPGFDSSYFNLASYYFFKSYFFDEKYLYRDVAMYWSPLTSYKKDKHLLKFEIIKKTLQLNVKK